MQKDNKIEMDKDISDKLSERLKNGLGDILKNFKKEIDKTNKFTQQSPQTKKLYDDIKVLFNKMINEFNLSINQLKGGAMLKQNY